LGPFLSLNSEGGQLNPPPPRTNGISAARLVRTGSKVEPEGLPRVLSRLNLALLISGFIPLGSFERWAAHPHPPPGRASVQPPAWYALEVWWNQQEVTTRITTPYYRATGDGFLVFLAILDFFLVLPVVWSWFKVDFGVYKCLCFGILLSSCFQGPRTQPGVTEAFPQGIDWINRFK